MSPSILHYLCLIGAFLSVYGNVTTTSSSTKKVEINNAVADNHNTTTAFQTPLSTTITTITTTVPTITTTKCPYDPKKYLVELNCSENGNDGPSFKCYWKNSANISGYTLNHTVTSPDTTENVEKKEDDFKINVMNAEPGFLYNITTCIYATCVSKCASGSFVTAPHIDEGVISDHKATENEITITLNRKLLQGKIEYFEISLFSDSDQLNTTTISSNVVNYTFTNLDPGSRYEIKIKSVSHNKSSEYVEETFYTVPTAPVVEKNDTPQIFPRKIKLKLIDDKSNYVKSCFRIIVSFGYLDTEMLKFMNIVNVSSFELNNEFVEWLKANSKHRNTSSHKNSVCVEGHEHTFSHLSPNSAYEIEIHNEINDQKLLSKSITVHLATDIDVPKRIDCDTSLYTNNTTYESATIQMYNTFSEEHSKIKNITLFISEQSNPDNHDYVDKLNMFEEVFLSKTYQHCEKDTKHVNNLRMEKNYEAHLRAYNVKDGYTDSEVFKFKTKASDQAMSIVMLVILVILVIVLLTVICFLMMYVISNRHGKMRMKKHSITKSSSSFKHFFSTGIRERLTSFKAHSIVESKPIKPKEFVEQVCIMEKDSGLKFTDEFDDLKNVGVGLTQEDSVIQCNRVKNRFTNILPYDITRVKLSVIENEEGTDYINASWIPGFSSKREFIATQGPMPATVDDFWRMVWEHKCRAIVMLTQCVEKNRIKCEKYWPSGETHSVYGDLQVSLVDQEEQNMWHIKLFKICQGDDIHMVKHFHYVDWPDMNVPDLQSLISFTALIRNSLLDRDLEDESKPDGPIVVHCSAGVGRSGTYIALDTLIHQIENGNDLDIYGIVYKMRMARVNMVQTEQQYVFLYQAVKCLIENKNYYEELNKGDQSPFNQDNLEGEVQTAEEGGSPACIVQHDYVNITPDDYVNFTPNDADAAANDVSKKDTSEPTSNHVVQPVPYSPANINNYEALKKE